ncbi:MAG: hypothetical protein LBL87_06520 [Ruminococcus sp.]|jgi:hypothetical protein|nr:hypothetical protein [Ruminococcus sp.]
MNLFEIYITYVSWGTDGKNRPVLIYDEINGMVTFNPITTKFKNKSAAVKSQFFKINDWKAAGLTSESYVDTGTLLELPKSAFRNNAIGKLTESDKNALLKFLSK